MSRGITTPSDPPTGIAGVGGVDGYAHDPARARRISDTVSRAFSVNANQVDMPEDSTSSIGEPGVIPHAFKIAAASLRQEAAILRVTALYKQALSVPRVTSTSSIKSPKITATPTVPNIKPLQAFDPRTDKPAGMNLMHGVQTVSNGADTTASFTSLSRRLQGSPI